MQRVDQTATCAVGVLEKRACMGNGYNSRTDYGFQLEFEVAVGVLVNE